MDISIVAWIYLSIFYALWEAVKNTKYFTKLVFTLFSIQTTICCRCKKMETAPKIDPIGTIRRNGLFQKKPFIFNLPFIKYKNWINKTSLFLSFSSPKMSLSAAKKVKCFLGLKVFPGFSKHFLKMNLANFKISKKRVKKYILDQKITLF